MDESETKRKNDYCKELNSFIEICEQDLQTIFSKIGWALEDTVHDNQMVVCPFFSSHKLPMKSLEKHLEICQWKAEGYSEFDKPFSESKLQQNDCSSITFDEELQKKVLVEAKEKDATLNIGVGEQLIPRTSDRLFSDFTRDERRCLYDYVISHTQKPEIGRDIMDLNENNKDSDSNENSILMRLVQERNMKRRRARHRGVHTNKKSHSEILREVIGQQMEMYMEYLNQKNDNNSKKEIHQIMEQTKKENSNKVVDKIKYSAREYENKKEKREIYTSRSRSRSRGRSRSKLRARYRSRSRSRSRTKHKKKNRHRSKDRQEVEKRRKRSKSKDRKSKHKEHKKKKKRSRS